MVSVINVILDLALENLNMGPFSYGARFGLIEPNSSLCPTTSKHAFGFVLFGMKSQWWNQYAFTTLQFCGLEDQDFIYMLNMFYIPLILLMK